MKTNFDLVKDRSVVMDATPYKIFPTVKDFVDFLGKAVFDRMTQVCTSIEFKEPSYRKNLRGNI